MKKLAIALLSLPLAALGGAALAGDPAAGEAKAGMCLDCHFSDDFAGQDAGEIEALIRQALAGEIKHAAEIKNLAEDDIADVAAWFAQEGGQ